MWERVSTCAYAQQKQYQSLFIRCGQESPHLAAALPVLQKSLKIYSGEFGSPALSRTLDAQFEQRIRSEDILPTS